MEPEQPQTNPIAKRSEPFGAVRNDAEGFGSLPHGSESFRTVRNHSERTEAHTLTVREVARLFEHAGVARTERSIVNWCQRIDGQVPRLDSYFDPNEHKYYITPQSVERAIQEELSKATKGNGLSSGPVGNIPKASEREAGSLDSVSEKETTRIKKLEQDLQDLKITNRAKDYFIEQLQQEREQFGAERDRYVEKLIASNRRVGELETRLLQLEEPHGSGIEKEEPPHR